MARFPIATLLVAVSSMLSCAAISEDEAKKFVELVEEIAARSGGVADDSEIEWNVKVEGPQPTVQTTSGLLYGVDTGRSSGFFTIPYAEPPVGSLRYMPPVPLDTPSDPRNVSQPNVIRCPQPRALCLRKNCTKEDCLYLSIHVPQGVDLTDPNNPPTDRLPVMFWIHGGAFFLGAGTSGPFDGRYLSNVTNAIIVTINYRLGPLGFLVFDEGENAIVGNQGIKDQQLAMQWVQDNIENFGGDKNRVTIFGESAGAQSVMLHLLSDVSDPLFQQAIMESNPGVYPYPYRDEALNTTDRLVRILKLTTRCAIARRCLYDATADQLMTAMYLMMVGSAVRLNMPDAVEAFRPYLDGQEFKGPPLKLFKEGQWQKNKRFIIGTNLGELDVLKFLNPLRLEINEEGYRVLTSLLLGHETGQQVSDKYVDLANQENFNDYGLVFGKMMTDLVFECPSRALARYAYETSTAEDPVYLYIYSHWFNGRHCNASWPFLSQFCGYAFHASEVFFVFRTLEHMGFSAKEEDISVYNQFSAYWGSFARTGNTSEGLEYPIPGSEAPIAMRVWPPYADAIRPQNAWPNLRIDDPSADVNYNFEQDICDFWDGMGVYTDAAASDLPPTDPVVITIPTTTSTTGEATIDRPSIFLLCVAIISSATVRLFD